MNNMHQLRDSLRRTQVSVSGSASEYLAFVLGAEHYTINILCVQEISSYSQSNGYHQRAGAHQEKPSVRLLLQLLFDLLKLTRSADRGAIMGMIRSFKDRAGSSVNYTEE